ncbi:MAG: DUF5696 domain-containing protein [Defluviitaleaceae bacterium]|nr:DUF5696 domain-containing protein [Defluviitaleaceae bacterium]
MKKIKNFRAIILFFLIFLFACGIYIFWRRSFGVYDFSYLTRRFDSGEASEFVPLGEKEGKLLAAESEFLRLYIDPETTAVSVFDKRNGHTWFSSPPDVDADAIAIPFQKNMMKSNLGFRFFDGVRREHQRWLFDDCVARNQFEIEAIAGGISVTYKVGDLDLGIDAVPFFIETERFNERVLAQANPDDWERVRRFWNPSRELDGFMQMSNSIRTRPIDIGIMLRIFNEIGYTLEELELDNAAANVELEIDKNFFIVVMEFILDGEKLKINLPLEKFEVNGDDANIFQIDLLPFFGAGGLEDEGFILVPGGSGGLINFNNGKFREAMFETQVYGVDFLTTTMHPQVTQPARLPVLGIKNNGAAMFAHVYGGQALATVLADVSGRTNSYNNAWFRFILRSSMTLNMSAIPGTTTSDLTIVQKFPYTGDICVMYHFVAGENPGVGEMARTYRDFLVSEGALSPLEQNGDRSLFLDVIGGVDVQRYILGTPFIGIETMTTARDANNFVDFFNANGIETIQMQLHGWFNRGVNHDVAKKIKLISSVAKKNELHELNLRLKKNNGGIFPSVNFKTTNWFSRNFNSTFEAARDGGGFFGFMTRVSRDTLSSRFTNHKNALHLLIHPAVLPLHVDKFLPAYEKKVSLDSIMLNDLGDLLTESIYMRDAVDREHSRLIAVSQMRRLREKIPRLLIAGGNDYSFEFATHLVDVPTEADMFMLIDCEIPFYSMVVHGFLEFAGSPANMRENYDEQRVLLNSLATGASPRYIVSQKPTRHAQNSPHERFYSTHFENWNAKIISHYKIFNDVYKNLRTEQIVDFKILRGGEIGTHGRDQVTVTIFSNGTRIYVNQTREDFDDGRIFVEAMGYVVVE